MDMDRSTFLAQRRTGIGGSDMAALLGVDQFGRTARDVWEDKIFGRPDDTDSSPDFQRGHYLEPIVRDMYARETGWTVQTPPMQRHLSETWAIANLDGIALPDDGAPGVLEIKTPRMAGFLAMEQGGPTHQYLVQIQHYLGVTGLNRAELAVFSAEMWRMIRLPIERDDALIHAMWDIARDFWERYVLTAIPPEADLAGNVNLPPLDPALARLDSPEWTTAAAAWREARAILKDAETYEKHCRAALVTLAQSTGKARVRGAGIALNIDKHGTPRLRDLMEKAA